MIYTVLLGDRKVGYELTRKKVKNINLRIYPDGRIKVSASARVPFETIEQFMKSRAAFILGALDKYRAEKEEAPTERFLNDNDSVRLFDEGLTLKVFEGKRIRAQRMEDELWLFVKDQEDIAAKQKALDEYLKRELSERISITLPEIFERFEAFKIEMPEIKIRKMKSRWGSCNSVDGIVTVNLLLTEHPQKCLEFVLAHELAHLVHPNHSKSFYEVLDGVMLDWKERKRLLNGR